MPRAAIALMIGWFVLGACFAERQEHEAAPGASPELTLLDELGNPVPTGLAEKSQASCVSCACPRGQACNHLGVCAGYPLFGPIPGPPLWPACVCDSQCPTGSVCSLSNGYGYCQVPTCAAFWDVAVVPPNGTANFGVSSQWMPAGSYSRLYGTRNGVLDTDGLLYNTVAGSFLVQNAPGLAGFYMRYVRMFGPDHTPLCQSEPVYITLQ
jgi:hypothetical protein